MSHNHIDHAYACDISKHFETNTETDVTDGRNLNDSEGLEQTGSEHLNDTLVSKQTANVHETFTQSGLADLRVSQKKVVVESVNAADLGAVHEKLIRSSPNKSWYLNDKNTALSKKRKLSSSSTESEVSETEQMDVNKETKSDKVNIDDKSHSVSPFEKEYTPMSPIPWNETANNDVEEQKERPPLKAITDRKEECDAEHNGNKTDDSQTDAQINGIDTENRDHGYAKEADATDNQEVENDMNESDLQNMSQTSEVNGSLDARGEDLNDSADPDSENKIVSPTVLIRPKGRPPGKKRRRFSGWSTVTRVSPRKRSTESKTSPGTPVKETGTSTEESPLDTSAATTGDTNADEPEERLRRKSRTPLRQNVDEFLVDDKVFEEVIDPKPLKEKKAKFAKHPDLSPDKIEVYSVPFKYGWKRELVLRGVWDDYKCKYPPMDVYYHPPSGTGRKIRSMVGVADWIAKNETPLVADNFTFMRRPVGIESGEVVRHASLQRGRAQLMKKRVDNSETTPKIKKRKPEIVIECDTDEVVVNSLLAADAPILASQLMAPVSRASVSTPTPQGTDSATEDEESKKDSVSKENADKEDNDQATQNEKVETMFPSSESVIISPPKKKFKSTARKSTTQKVFRKPKPKYPGIESLCTLNCPGLEGISPLLRCNVCMCLFHPECVNYRGDIESGFVCLRCVDQCNTIPQETTVVMEDGIMRVPDPTTFGSIASTPPTPVSIKMTQATTSSVLPNFGNLLSPVVTVTNSSSLEQVSTPAVEASHIRSSPALARVSTPASSPATVRVSTPAVLKGFAAQIKQEPIDPDELPKDGRLSRGQQASIEALGTLKHMISSRLEQSIANGVPNLASQLAYRSDSSISEMPYLGLSSTAVFTPNLPGRVMTSKPRPLGISSVGSSLYPSIPGKGMQKNMTRFINPATGLHSSVPSIIQLPVVNSMSNNTILQTNSGIKLVPIGPPVKLTNGLPPSLPGMPINPVTSVQPLLSSVTTTTKPTQTTSTVAGSPLMVTMSSTVTSTSVKESTPKTKTIHTVINTNAVCAPKNGQLLTLPPAVVKKITPNKPLQLKINNVQINVPPSGFFFTPDGLKVFVPSNTFPTADGDFCFTVADDKTINLNSDPASREKSNSDQIRDADKNSHSDNKSEKSSSDTVRTCEETKSSEKPDIRRSTRYRKCCHIHKLYGGYDCMQHIFKLLNIRDLISVGMVCRTWRMISRHPVLWQDVKFNDVKVSSWQAAMQFLASRKVKGINLLGLSHYDEPNRTWHQLISSLSDLATLKRITFGVVPATVLHSVTERLTQLESLKAESISDFNNKSMWNRPTKLDVGKFACLTGLKELKLKGIGGLSAPSFSFSGGLPELSMLKNLDKLSLTSLRSVPETQFHFISKLTQLQELALGDCNTWMSETFFQLSKLTNLKFLRLEHGGEIPDVGLGDALVNMKKLERLELYTYTVADSLGSYLKQLPLLKVLILWPDNCFLPAEVNTNTLKSVSELTSLERLDWAIPSGCNTSIILDSNENTGPVSCNDGLEWIPFHTEKSDEEAEDEDHDRINEKKQTEYIRLHELQERVTKCLPNTKTNVHCVTP